MDELQISGKRFISSRRIAKDNGYHTDYIGQLIRGGKIKGQKVGRTWYVDALSFDAYLGTEPVVEKAESSVEVEGVALAAKEGSSAGRESAVPADFNSQESEAEGVKVQETKKEDETSVGILVTAQIENGNATMTEAASASQFTDTYKNIEEVEEGQSSNFEQSRQSQAINTEAVISNKMNKEVSYSERADSVSEAQEAQGARKADIPSVIAIRKIAQASKGLRYITDDESLMPEILITTNESRSPKANIKNIRQTDHATEEVEEANDAEKVVIERRGRRGFMTAGIVVAGMAVFIASAAFSSALSQTIAIQAGNSASVGYSLNW